MNGTVKVNLILLTDLEEGKTYTLHEDLSPLGFNLANDFTFEVTKEKENQTVEMIDTVTEVNKTDVDGKAVKEATLSIVSEKTKDIVDQWVTGQHIIRSLIRMSKLN